MDCIILSGFEGPVWNRAIGPYQLCFYLRKHGYSAMVIDFVNHMLEREIDKLLKKFVTNETKIIGISTTFLSKQNDLISNTHDNEDNQIIPKNIIKSLEKMKIEFSNIKIVAGGSRSLNVKNSKIIDVLVHGFAEDSLLFLIKNINSSNLKLLPKLENKISITKDNEDWKIEKLDFKFSDQDGILENETLPIEISRGCVFNCGFCSYPLNGKKKFDYLRDPKFVADELQYNYEKWKIKNYVLTDDTFNDSTFKLEKLLIEIKKLPFKINFVSYIRLDLIKAHQEQVNLLKELGLMSAFFGLETLNQKSATIIGKGGNIKSIKDFLPKLYYDLWNKEISIFSSFIIGLPYETEASIKDTFNWLLPYKSDFNPVFWPLTFRNGFYLSQFEKNPSKFNYTVIDEFTWKSPWMDSNKALELTNESNSIFNKSKPSTWLTASLLTHGFDKNELLKTEIAELDFKKLYKQKIKMVKQYKENLLNL
jgi:radical SAM superfamily enzyme YgiQ (UPF0313 family)